jgi:hypothetical protein
MVYVFDDFSLDTDRRELRRRGSLVPVQPQVFVSCSISSRSAIAL